MRRRTRRAYRALLWLLLAALLVAAGLAGMRLWQLARERAQAERLLWEMRRAALSAPANPVQADTPPEAASQAGREPSSYTAPGQENDCLPGSSLGPGAGAGAGAVPGAPSAPFSQEGAGEKPSVHTCPVDFEALRARCPDAAAWLTGCGGAIDTPIVQGVDNIYYLEHLPDGTRNRLGAAFLDSRILPTISRFYSAIIWIRAAAYFLRC